jgi:ATP-dependent RNA helicase RhlE
VLVATPGRLLDLVNQRAVTLNQVEILVLDEADRMLDMGFIHDIKRIVAMLRGERQTLFFSATMPQEITRLADAMLRDPVRVAVTPQATTVERIAQRVIHTEKSAKPALLLELLKTETTDRVLVFTRTKHGADKVVRGLEKTGFLAEAIHGNKSQNQRERVLADFRSGKLRILIATDIAARGIDVDGVSHVINYDLPNVPESYVHRIGRTARAGADGIAISFCDQEEGAFLRDIERMIRMTIPATGEKQAHRPAQRNSGNRGNVRRAAADIGAKMAASAPAAAAAIMAAIVPRRPATAIRAAPAITMATNKCARKRRRGSQATSELLHSSSARANRAVMLATARRDKATGETIGWRRKNCWSSTAR